MVFFLRIYHWPYTNQASRALAYLMCLCFTHIYSCEDYRQTFNFIIRLVQMLEECLCERSLGWSIGGGFLECLSRGSRKMRWNKKKERKEKQVEKTNFIFPFHFTQRLLVFSAYRFSIIYISSMFIFPIFPLTSSASAFFLRWVCVRCVVVLLSARVLYGMAHRRETSEWIQYVNMLRGRGKNIISYFISFSTRRCVVSLPPHRTLIFHPCSCFFPVLFFDSRCVEYVFFKYYPLHSH